MPRDGRHRMRLAHYDYTQSGMYFVTVCTCRRSCLFGNIADDVMQANTFGRCVENAWMDLPLHFSRVELDAFVVMPNHVHGIVVLTGESVPPDVGAQHAAPLPKPAHRISGRTLPGSLGTIVHSFKAAATHSINTCRHTPGAMVWQRNYYEHVIRNERELASIREYIRNNPLQWALDRENPHVAARAGAQHAAPLLQDGTPPDNIADIFGGIRP